MPEFVFATCQVGAEAALKGEIARDAPALRFAYSRPGFLTFKRLDEFAASASASETHAARGKKVECPLSSAVFARASGISLGKVGCATIEDRAADVWRLAGDRPYRRLHVWRRDLVGADFHGKLIEPPPSIAEVEAAIRAVAARCGRPPCDFDPSQPTRPGDLVLDCVIVEPDEWWVGWHEAESVTSCWPGGRFEVPLPPDAVSRAWLKMEEALAWSGLPIAPGDLCAEIGSAPAAPARRCWATACV